MTILRKKHLPQPHIKLQGETIQYVDSFKLLGITISSDLSWKPHITAVASKAKKFLGFLYHVFRVSSRNCPSRLYEVVVLPHLDYCSSVWDPSTKFTSNCWRTCRRSQPRLPQIVDHMILVSWKNFTGPSSAVIGNSRRSACVTGSCQANQLSQQQPPSLTRDQ